MPFENIRKSVIFSGGIEEDQYYEMAEAAIGGVS